MKERTKVKSLAGRRPFPTMEPRRALQKSNVIEGLFTIHLKAYGFWYFLNVSRTTGRISKLFVLTCASIVFVLIFYFIFQIMFIFTTQLDLQKIAFVYLVVAPCLQDFNKIFFFLTRMQEICLIYDTLQEDFLDSIPKHKLPAVKEIYKSTAKKCNLACSFAFSCLIVAASIWLCVPGYDTDDPTSGRKKVMSGWYPFHYSDSPAYEMVYSYECFMTMWGGGWYCVFECAIVMPLVCLCGHFDALSYHIATLKKSDMVHVLGRSSASRLENNAFLNDQLKNIIKDYEKLIRYSDIIKETYNLMVTIILGSEIGNLTVIVLHLLFEDKDAMFVLKTCTFMSFQLIEVVLICVTSDMMEEAVSLLSTVLICRHPFCSRIQNYFEFVQMMSSGVREALYCNEWYRADRKMVTTQQLMMVRASLPLRLTAVRMYPVNLETLLSIFQFIYSTAALLSKMK